MKFLHSHLHHSMLSYTPDIPHRALLPICFDILLRWVSKIDKPKRFYICRTNPLNDALAELSDNEKFIC